MTSLRLIILNDNGLSMLFTTLKLAPSQCPPRICCHCCDVPQEPLVADSFNGGASDGVSWDCTWDCTFFSTITNFAHHLCPCYQICQCQPPPSPHHQCYPPPLPSHIIQLVMMSCIYIQSTSEISCTNQWTCSTLPRGCSMSRTHVPFLSYLALWLPTCSWAGHSCQWLPNTPKSSGFNVNSQQI